MEEQYQLTQNDITSINFKSYFKQNSHYTSTFFFRKKRKKKKRTSRSQTFYKKYIFKNFLRPATLLKKRHRNWYFHVKFGNFFKNTFLHLQTSCCFWKYTYEVRHKKVVLIPEIGRVKFFFITRSHSRSNVYQNIYF